MSTQWPPRLEARCVTSAVFSLVCFFLAIWMHDVVVEFYPFAAAFWDNYLFCSGFAFEFFSLSLFSLNFVEALKVHCICVHCEGSRWSEKSPTRNPSWGGVFSKGVGAVQCGKRKVNPGALNCRSIPHPSN